MRTAGSKGYFSVVQGCRPAAISRARSTPLVSRFKRSARAVISPSGVSGWMRARSNRKMPGPAVRPRIEQTFQSPCPCQRRDVGTFPQVAPHATSRKVVGGRRSPVLSAYNVIDLVRRIRVVRVQQAILASVAGSLGHKRPRSYVNFRRQVATECRPALSP